MKQQIAAALSVCICLTGCNANRDLTLQKDDIPVVPVETTMTEQTKGTAAEGSATIAVKKTRTTTVQTVTGGKITETAADTAKPASVPQAGTEATAAQRRTDGNQTASAPKKYTENDLIGKWETVSFTKSTGESIAYDLSDSVHRSYYVALELNDKGQSAMIVGTEGHPATTSLIGNILSVYTVNRTNPISMDFTVSDDKKRLTVELLDGRLTATLKRINNDFSILRYQSDEPEADFSRLAGDWNYQREQTQVESIYDTVGFVTVEADGRYVYQPADGSLRRRGTVQVEYQELSGSKVPFFVFYEDEGHARWISTDSCEPSGRGTFAIGGSAARLKPWNPQGNKYDHYVGQWQSSNCTIQISIKDAGYLVKIRRDDSASEYREWIYSCEGSPDNISLTCPGGGTLARVAIAEDGTETRTEVFGEGSTSFKLENGVLLWMDDSAAEMIFEKLG